MGDRVNILGIEYEVRYVNNLVEIENLFGEIDYRKQIIRIDESMNDDRKKVTFIHEVIHGIFEGLGFNELNQDEEKIQSIASALYLVLKSNPNLFSFFGL